MSWLSRLGLKGRLKDDPHLLEELRKGYEAAQVGRLSMNLEDYLGDRTPLKRLIGAQAHFETKTGRKNMDATTLTKDGYDLDTFEYPADWDTWPKSWDEEPNPSKLPIVP